jgi:hypothetical protein
MSALGQKRCISQVHEVLIGDVGAVLLNKGRAFCKKDTLNILREIASARVRPSAKRIRHIVVLKILLVSICKPASHFQACFFPLPWLMQPGHFYLWNVAG